MDDFAKLIVAGACRGDPYVKHPSWYDAFLLYKAFAPKVLGWTFRLLLGADSSRKTSLVGVGRPLLESASPKKPSSPMTGSRLAYAPQQMKVE